MKTSLENIVGEARELFRERGYAGMSMQDLAERVGLKKPSLYTRFPSKEALVPEVLSRTVEETLARLPATDDDPLAAYRKVVGRIAKTLTDRKRCVGAHLALGVSDATPMAQASVRDFFAALRDGIAATLRPVTDAATAETLATDVLARLEGAAVWLAATDDTGAMTRAVVSAIEDAERLSGVPTG